MAVQGVIFDVGGTLIWGDRRRLEEGAAWATTNFFRSHGYAGDPEVLWESILACRQRALEWAPRQYVTVQALQDAASRCGFHLEGDLLLAAEEAFFAPEVAATVAIPGMPELVQSLHGHTRVALFSNTTSDKFIRRMMDRLGILACFDPLVTSAGCGWRKPHPCGFDIILQAWQVPPESVVMVGDSVEADVLGAQARGMRAIWLRADVEPDQPDSSGPADAVADSAADVRRTLQAWSSETN